MFVHVPPTAFSYTKRAMHSHREILNETVTLWSPFQLGKSGFHVLLTVWLVPVYSRGLLNTGCWTRVRIQGPSFYLWPQTPATHPGKAACLCAAGLRNTAFKALTPEGERRHTAEQNTGWHRREARGESAEAARNRVAPNSPASACTSVHNGILVTRSL